MRSLDIQRISDMKKALTRKMVKKLKDEMRDSAESSYLSILPQDEFL